LDWYPVSWNNLQLCTDLKACCCKSLLTFQIHSNWGWNKGLEGIKLGSKQNSLNNSGYIHLPQLNGILTEYGKMRPPECTDTSPCQQRHPSPHHLGCPLPQKGWHLFFQPNQALKKGFPNCGYMCPSSFLLCSALLSSSATYNKVSVLFFEVSNHQMPK
jgi:hypothetical protein